jgi:hypothetical protein
VLVYLFGQNYDEVTSAEVFMESCMKNQFYYAGTIFGSNGEGYIQFTLCVKEEKLESNQSILPQE